RWRGTVAAWAMSSACPTRKRLPAWKYSGDGGFGMLEVVVGVIGGGEACAFSEDSSDDRARGQAVYADTFYAQLHGGAMREVYRYGLRHEVVVAAQPRPRAVNTGDIDDVAGSLRSHHWDRILHGASTPAYVQGDRGVKSF